MDRKTPWLRIVADGVAIVVSILLAFGIQAWWEGRQARRDAEVALATLATDIQGARASIERAQARRERRMTTISALVSATSADQPRVEDDSLYAWIGEMWGARAPQDHLPSLQELRSSGILTPIESTDLQRALSEFSRQSAVLGLQEERVLRTWEEELRPYLVAKSDVLRQLQASERPSVSSLESLPPGFASGLDDLLEDRQFQNLLLVRMNRTAGAISLGEDLLALLDDLESLISRELHRE